MVIQSDRLDPVDQAVFDAARRGLGQAGWRSVLALDGLEVFVGPGRALRVRQIHRCCILIGEYRPHGQALSALVGGSRTPREVARAAVDGGWGRYVLVWRTDAGELAVLRDPGGTVDCMVWSRGGLGLAADQPPPEVDILLPDSLAIDWEGLGEIVAQPGLVSDQPPLRGLTAVAPGEFALVTGRPVREAAWTPADVWRKRCSDSTPDALRSVVDAAVAAETAGHERLVGEMSGGLDSAIVSSSLAASGGAGRARFINYYGDRAEGDERVYAEANARKNRLSLETARKPVAAITPELLAPLGWGLRPALHGVDTAYDRDMADRLKLSLIHI